MPIVVVSRKIVDVRRWRASGVAISVRSVPGRFFFIWMGV
jgi:hypothetical protein